MYHLHYQNHVGLHGGRTYGHAVSKDFTHWAHMPISIWNDHPYDERAIYTGSATVVDGQVVQVYPGLCDTKGKGCPGGTNLCIAKPADPSDPLQTNWTKEYKDTGAVNPIVNNTGRDPSTAWRTPAGEWRLTTFDTVIMGSMDFKTWYRIGPQPGFPHGECPSFFPLPKDTPGAGAAPLDAPPRPTHVHKASHGGKDWMQVGTYVANGVKQNGDWKNPTTEVMIDHGALYASKDFYDPVKERRINWGWARVPPASTQTLPREVTWNPELQQLVYSPVEEQQALRGKTLANLVKTSLKANQTMPLFDHTAEAPGAGNTSEVQLSFPIPTEAGVFGVVVMAGADTGKSGTLFYVDYTPPTAQGSPYTVQVGATSMPYQTGGDSVYQRMMSGYDLPGHDYSVRHVTYDDPKICQQACDADAKCQAWTLVPHTKCCLKRQVPAYRKNDQTKTFTSGVKKPGSGPAQGTTSVLNMSPSDTSISLSVYVDNTFSEAYWQNGRVAMTVVTPATKEAAVAAYANTDVMVTSAQVFTVNSIWVSPEQVLRA